MPQPDDTISIIIGGQSFTGWQSAKITVSCERMPPSFDLIATDRNPDTGALAVLPPASPCQVMIGSDLVITGYVDRYLPRIGARQHDVRIMGRGKTEDLVDCSITSDILNGMQISTSSLLDLATRIASKFGAPTPIAVTSLAGGNVPVTALNSGAPLVFNATLQQTPYEILEEVARYAGVLIYEGPDGSLILANVGTSSMGSGFSQGVNVQSADAAFTMDQRYSEYLPVLMSTNMFGQQGIGGTSFPKAFDNGVPRFRPLFVVSEQFQWGQSFAEKRAQWEASRRWGRSNVLNATCDSWRDASGALWRPNAFAPIDIAALKLGKLQQPWVIGTISFIIDPERGRVAEVMLMPKEAFQPEPTILVPWMYNPNDPAGPPAGSGGAGPGLPAGPSFPGEGSVDNPPTPPTPPVPPAGGGAAPAPLPGPEENPNAVYSTGT
jgi:prophage tail gpP-like protein